MIIRKTEEDDRRLVHSPEGGKQQLEDDGDRRRNDPGPALGGEPGRSNCPDQLIE